MSLVWERVVNDWENKEMKEIGRKKRKIIKKEKQTAKRGANGKEKKTLE